MKTIAISEFKAHALKVLNDVAKSQETIVITKRGKPLAQVVPYRKSAMKTPPGKLADAFVFENDIIAPLGEGLWEAMSIKCLLNHHKPLNQSILKYLCILITTIRMGLPPVIGY